MMAMKVVGCVVECKQAGGAEKYIWENYVLHYNISIRRPIAIRVR